MVHSCLYCVNVVLLCGHCGLQQGNDLIDVARWDHFSVAVRASEVGRF